MNNSYLSEDLENSSHRANRTQSSVRRDRSSVDDATSQQLQAILNLPGSVEAGKKIVSDCFDLLVSIAQASLTNQEDHKRGVTQVMPLSFGEDAGQHWRKGMRCEGSRMAVFLDFSPHSLCPFATHDSVSLGLGRPRDCCGEEPLRSFKPHLPSADELTSSTIWSHAVSSSISCLEVARHSSTRFLKLPTLRPANVDPVWGRRRALEQSRKSPSIYECE